MTVCKNEKFGAGVIVIVIHDLQWKGRKTNKHISFQAWKVLWLTHDWFRSTAEAIKYFFLFVKIEEMSWLGFVCGDNWIYVINDVNYLWCKYFHLELTCFQCLFLTELCNLLICIPYLLLDSSLTELCCLLGIYAFMLTSENCFSLMHVTLSVVQLLSLLFSDLGSLFALLI